MGFRSFARQFNSISPYPLNRVGLCTWKYNGTQYRIEARSKGFSVSVLYLGTWNTVSSFCYSSTDRFDIETIVKAYMPTPQ
jgi:hypothetical protein